MRAKNVDEIDFSSTSGLTLHLMEPAKIGPWPTTIICDRQVNTL